SRKNRLTPDPTTIVMNNIRILASITRPFRISGSKLIACTTLHVMTIKIKRSEERRVGKECRSRRSRSQQKKKKRQQRKGKGEQRRKARKAQRTHTRSHHKQEDTPIQ